MTIHATTRQPGDGAWPGSPLGRQIKSCLGYAKAIARTARADRAANDRASYEAALDTTGGDRDRARTIVAVDQMLARVNRANGDRLIAEDEKRAAGQNAYYQNLREQAHANGAKGGRRRAAAAKRAGGTTKRGPKPPATDGARAYKNWRARLLRARRHGCEDPPMPAGAVAP